jgi:hypothetical protein
MLLERRMLSETWVAGLRNKRNLNNAYVG